MLPPRETPSRHTSLEKEARPTFWRRLRYNAIQHHQQRGPHSVRPPLCSLFPTPLLHLVLPLLLSTAGPCSSAPCSPCCGARRRLQYNARAHSTLPLLFLQGSCRGSVLPRLPPPLYTMHRYACRPRGLSPPFISRSSFHSLMFSPVCTPDKEQPPFPNTFSCLCEVALWPGP